MVEGFELSLPHFCGYCGNFRADVNKTEITCFGDKFPKYQIEITCDHVATCSKVAERVKEKYNASDNQ